MKGEVVAWHLLKGELKSPQADGRICFAQDGGLDLGTMGNWGERGPLTAPFYSWKAGLREGKSIHLAAHREFQTVGRGVIQDSQCRDCPSSSKFTSQTCVPRAPLSRMPLSWCGGRTAECSFTPAPGRVAPSWESSWESGRETHLPLSREESCRARSFDSRGAGGRWTDPTLGKTPNTC